VQLSFKLDTLLSNGIDKAFCEVGMMKRRSILSASITTVLGLALGATIARTARAHAYLDHASPAVGSTVKQPPTVISLWFTQKLEPAFSAATVVDEAGQRVDQADAKVDAQDAALLRVSLKPLPPGTYKVAWRVVSVDTHATQGDFTFRVTGG
jgi:copper resistance protein C